MIYSERLQKLPVQFFSTLVNKVNKAIDEGRDIINLGQGNPDQPTPSHIVKALQTAAEDPGTHKYSLFRGLPDLKKAAADFYQNQYGVTLDPETEVAIFLGQKQVLLSCLCVCSTKGSLCSYLIRDIPTIYQVSHWPM